MSSDRTGTRLADRTYRLLHRAWGPAPSTRDTIITMVVLAALVTVLAIAQVARRQQVVRAGFDLSRATHELQARRAEHRALEVELATLTHPERLRALATRLGMIPAQPNQTRVVPAKPAEVTK